MLSTDININKKKNKFKLFFGCYYSLLIVGINLF